VLTKTHSEKTFLPDGGKENNWVGLAFNLRGTSPNKGRDTTEKKEEEKPRKGSRES